MDHMDIGLDHRMLGHEYGAAVLKRLDGCLIRADPLGNIHNLLLVKPDYRTEYGHGTHLIGSRQGLHRLGSHLADAFTGNQA